MVTAMVPLNELVWAVLPAPLNDDCAAALRALGLSANGPCVGGVIEALPLRWVLVLADLAVVVVSASTIVTISPTPCARAPWISEV